MKSRLTFILLSILCGSQTVSAQLNWAAYNGSLPENAVIGGNEHGTDLPVCRALYKEAWHSGKVVGNNCNIGWGGDEIVISEFEVLVNQGAVRIEWVPLNGQIPANVVEAGVQEGKRILVGQADRAEDNSVHPGKIIGVPGEFICNYGYGGAEIVERTNYRILIATPVIEWTAYDGSLPENVVSGGKENGTSLAVCRGSYKGTAHPGKVVGGKCNIGYGGKEIELTAFEILVNGGVPLKWETFKGRIPNGAVKAADEKGKPLYVGQFTRPDGSVHAGKVLGAPGSYIFNYGFGGKEISVKTNFRILVLGQAFIDGGK